MTVKYPRAGSGTCVICGVWRKSLHRDHITPKFKGGSNEPENIQHICANCHEDKTREDLTGRVASEETRAKMSMRMMNNTLANPEAISVAQKGSPRSAEQRAAISLAHNGKKLTPEHCEKIGAAVRDRSMLNFLTKSNTQSKGCE